MRAALQSVWTWSAICGLILVWLPLLAVRRLLDRDPAHYHTGRWFRRLGAAMTRVNPAWTIRISGAEIDEPRRPYVVVSNHQSNADIPIISRLPWEMKWVAKAELFKVPILGWMLRLAGDIPVDRKDRRSRSLVLVTARDYLHKRCSVMFFPEGTRSRDGRVRRFSNGAFLLAIKEQVPVLPLAIDGTGDALPSDGWKFGRAEAIRLKVLPPVPTTDLTIDDAPLLREQVRRRIVEQLAAWRGTAPEAVDAERPGQRQPDSAGMPPATS